MSEEEEETAANTQHNGLFPTELYSCMLSKVLRALEVTQKPTEGSTQDPEYPRASDHSLPRKPSSHGGMPLPDVFHDVMRVEWEHLAKSKATHPIFSKLYAFTQGAIKEIKLPLVLT